MIVSCLYNLFVQVCFCLYNLLVEICFILVYNNWSRFVYVSLIVQFYECIYIIPSCRRDELKTGFPLQEGIFVYSRVFVQ